MTKEQVGVTSLLVLAALGIGVAVDTRLDEQKAEAIAEAEDAGEPYTLDYKCVPANAPVVCDAVDTSILGKGARRYKRIEMETESCVWAKTFTKTGLTVAAPANKRGIKPREDFDVLADSCVSADDVKGARTVAADGVRYAPGGCACRAFRQTCEYELDGGSWAMAPYGASLGRGYFPYMTFRGAGCLQKSCIGLASTKADGSPVDDTWPTECPNLADGGTE